MKQNEARNLTMMMDLYELTMANGYFNDQDKDVKVAFDVFFTGLHVAFLDFLKKPFFFFIGQ